VSSAIAGVTLAIDIQESPIPNLSRVSNIYHGSATYVYAFLVATTDKNTEASLRIAAYDLGYRLICPDGSVINQGFHRLEGWDRLDGEANLPVGQSIAGPTLPTAIGYWELELKKGRESRAEFQIVPHALSVPAGISLVDGDGDLIQLSYRALSKDRRCFGLINRAFYSNRPYIWTGEEPMDGQVVAGFMPGAIDIPGRVGTSVDIIDPALREIAERFGLIDIKRLYGNSGSVSGPVRSRIGESFTPCRNCDTYGLNFPVDADLHVLLDSLRALPRCEFAEPTLCGEPTTCTSPAHVPDDSLASESWHLDRTGVKCAWDWEIGDEGVTIGVIDMGVDFHLEDFGGGFGASKKIVAGWDYDANSDTFPDVKWGDDSDAQMANHGNWMNSVLAGLTNNDLQVAGVAGGWGGTAGVPGPPGLLCGIGPSIVHLKIRHDFGSWISDSLYAAIRDATVKYRCDVISLSFKANYRTALKREVSDCYLYGALLVSNTHNIYYNEGPTTFYPSCFRNDWVLCAQGSSRHPLSETDPVPERRVSMLDSLYDSPPLAKPWSGAWPVSNWPTPLLSVDVSAPASHMCLIYADSLGEEKPYYRCKDFYNGVSYATPQVAGVAALMLSENPDLTADDLQGLIGASCTDITSDYNEPGVDLSGWDKYTGWGRLIFADPLHPACYQVEHYDVAGGGVIFDSTTTRELVEFG